MSSACTSTRRRRRSCCAWTRSPRSRPWTIEAGRNPLDRKLSDLVGELATRSDTFRIRWARHNVRHHRTTAKHIHSAVAGDLTLTGDALELPGEDLILITYTAPADTPAQEQLNFLASWTASRANERMSGDEPQTSADR